MKLVFFSLWYFILSVYIGYAIPEEHIESKAKAKASQNNENSKWRRCPYSLKKLWHVEVSSFPFSAPPLVVDVNGDGGLDIVVAPFGETVTVIEGESGKHLHGSSWPQQNLDASVYSSPLQFDIDGDGIQDIFIVTSSGEGLFYSKTGISLVNFSFALPPAYVKTDWYKAKQAVGHDSVFKFVSVNREAGHVPVDPHVLSTPVLNMMRYLVLPVSYFYSNEDYSDAHTSKPWGNEDIKDKFYVTAVAILDLVEFRRTIQKKSKNDGKEFLTMHYLELRQTPVYDLFTPTVINLEEDSSEPEVVLGSTSGSLFILGMMSGKHRKGFPQNFGSVSGRVSAIDINGDGVLELFVLNTSGTVTCLDSTTGQIKWTAKIGGSSFAGSRTLDVDLDGHMDIVLATETGDVFALHGNNGSVISKYPYQAGSRIYGNILTTKLNQKKKGPMDMVFLSDDGDLHILASDQSCVSKISLGDTTLVDMLSNDIVLMNQGLEILVATADGSLICLGSGIETMPEELVEKDVRLSHRKFIYPRDALSQNDFTSSLSQPQIFIEDTTRNLKEVTGNSFYLDFSLQNLPLKQKFSLKVYLGNDLVYRVEHELPSSIPRWLKISTPDQPGEGLVTVVLNDQHGFSCTDSVYLRFNKLILLDLQWLVVTPFIAMVIILLVNHGFPAKDLLPVTFPFKSK